MNEQSPQTEAEPQPTTTDNRRRTPWLRRALYIAYPAAFIRDRAYIPLPRGERLYLRHSLYQTDTRIGAGLLREMVRSSASSRPCPNCGTPLVPSTQNATTDMGSESTADDIGTLNCPACGFSTTTPDSLPDNQASTIAQRAYKMSGIYTWAAIGSLFGGSCLGLLTHNLLTLAASLMLGASAAAQTAFYRYRGWQYATKHLFCARPPLGRWITWEKQNFLGGSTMPVSAPRTTVPIGTHTTPDNQNNNQQDSESER